MKQDYPSPEDSSSSAYFSMQGESAPQDTSTKRRVTVQFSGTNPRVVYVLLGITIVVFVLQLASPYFLTGLGPVTELIVEMYGLDPLAAQGMKVNELIVRGQIWRLLTPMLLHGSILHLGFNMYALYALGPGLERHYGHWRFLALYLLSGFAGNVASFLFSAAPSLGSSTAIFGLLGAEGVFLYQNSDVLGATARRALGNIVMIAAINLMIGFSPGSGIDNWGHMGGLVGGILFAWFAGPVLRVDGVYPMLQLVDEREDGAVLRAGLGVGGLFLLLAVMGIFLRV